MSSERSGWDVVSPTAWDTDVSFDTTQERSGDGSFLLAVDNVTKSHDIELITSKYIPIHGGRTMVAKFSLRTSTIAGHETCAMQVLEYNSALSLTATRTVFSGRPAAATTWETHHEYLTFNDGARFAKIYVYGNSGAGAAFNMWVDAALLTPGPTGSVVYSDTLQALTGGTWAMLTFEQRILDFGNGNTNFLLPLGTDTYTAPYAQWVLATAGMGIENADDDQVVGIGFFKNHVAGVWNPTHGKHAVRLGTTGGAPGTTGDLSITTSAPILLAKGDTLNAVGYSSVNKNTDPGLDNTWFGVQEVGITPP